MSNIQPKVRGLVLIIGIGGINLPTTSFADDANVSSVSQQLSSQQEILIEHHSLNGIHLAQQQAAHIIDSQQDFPDIRISAMELLQATNGSAHMEVSGEGQIRNDPCLPGAFSCTDKYSGLYVHTPNQSESLLGYRSVTTANLPGSSDASSSIATWGISPDPNVMGKLGTLNSVDGLLGGTTKSAYGVFGASNSTTQNSNYGVYGTSNQTNGYGVYGTNTSGGEAGHFNGPVGQEGGFGGIVKAAAYIYCSNTGSTVLRSFSPQGTSVTIANGGVNGQCTIDLGFPQLNQTYFQVSAIGDSPAPRSASCSFVEGAGNGNKLSCYRINAATGSGAGGNLMLTIY